MAQPTTPKTHAWRRVLLAITLILPCFAQKDPGVRGGAPGAGGPLAGLTTTELALFNEGRRRMVQLEAVCPASH